MRKCGYDTDTWYMPLSSGSVDSIASVQRSTILRLTGVCCVQKIDAADGRQTRDRKHSWGVSVEL